MITIKLTGALYATIVEDLQKRHPFAAERVGFVTGRRGTLANGQLVLLTRYHSIPDHQYVNDPGVGARIDSNAITWAMQAAYHGRPHREGIFHVHLHDHHGRTGMSRTDRREIPPVVRSVQSVGRNALHGFIILSLDHGSAWVSLPGQEESEETASIMVIGCPIGVFEKGEQQ